MSKVLSREFIVEKHTESHKADNENEYTVFLKGETKGSKMTMKVSSSARDIFETFPLGETLTVSFDYRWNFCTN